MSVATATPTAGRKTSAVDTGILLEAGTNEVEVLVFRVCNQMCGVNVAKVREARPLAKATFLPQFSDSIEGVVRVRDHVVPVVDLQQYLWKTHDHDNEQDERHLVLEFNDRLIAFRVQAIDRVHRISWKEVRPLPQGSGKDVPVTGIVLIDGKIVSILDFEAIGAKLGISGNVQVTENLTSPESRDTLAAPLVFADDSSLIRRMMGEALRRAGYTQVQAFSDGQDAWEYLAQLAADRTPKTIHQAVAAVITDIEMPRMDGFSLTRQIRAHAVLKDVPVILFSSLISKDNEKKGKQVGATAQVSKPRWDELSEMLVDVIGQVVVQS